MSDLPAGTVTFLFTDIEGSTRLWEERPEPMRAALRQHDDLLRACIESHGGHVFKTVGDAFCAAFPGPRAAVETVLACQQWLPALAVRTPDGALPLRVRMALHAGTAAGRDGDYFGPPLNRVARLLAIGHGGQALLSAAARDLLGGGLPQGVALQERSSHRLRDRHMAHFLVLAEAAEPRKEMGSPLAPNERPRYDRLVAEARAAMGDDAAFGAVWQEGRAMTLEQAIALDLEENDHGTPGATTI